MSKTTIMWLCLYFGGISVSFIKGPIYGLLTYMFTYYTQFSWAGKKLMYERWSLYASIALLASYILKKSSEKKLSYFKIPQMKWLILFVLNMLLVSPFAVAPEANNETIIDFLKIFVLYYLIVCVVRSKKHYKMFLWLQLWGNFLFGLQGYFKGTTGGRLEGIGGPNTNASNALANHLIMILPFTNNFFLYGNKWEKIGVILATPWILNAIILCNSRGAFLGIIAMAILVIIRSEKKIRKKMILGLIIGSVLFLYLTNAQFWNRMGTIDSYEKEGSATSRLETWRSAIRMIKDHPFGTGGDGWLHYSPVYIPEIVAAHGGLLRAVHNSYLKVATDFGIQGLLLYSLFIVSTLLELRKTRKRAGSYNDTFYYTESSAIEIAIWGHLITATFGSRPYFEALYWYAALAIALSNIQQSEINDRSHEKKDLPVHLNDKRDEIILR